MTPVATTRDACEPWSPGERAGPWRYYPLRTRGRCGVSPAKPVADANTRALFHQLAKTWHDETWYISSIKKRVAHPAYQKIIGIGPSAVGLILEELSSTPDYWYWALEAITREDPAPRAGTMQELRVAWLAWGKANGYIS